MLDGPFGAMDPIILYGTLSTMTMHIQLVCCANEIYYERCNIDDGMGAVELTSVHIGQNEGAEDGRES